MRETFSKVVEFLGKEEDVEVEVIMTDNKFDVRRKEDGFSLFSDENARVVVDFLQQAGAIDVPDETELIGKTFVVKSNLLQKQLIRFGRITDLPY